MTGTRQTGPSCPLGGVEGFIQMSRECAAGQWSGPSHGSLSPAFAEFRSQFAAGSGGRTLNRNPAPSLSATGQCQRNFPEYRPLECAALNKDHVSRIGPSHPPFACSYLFASILKCSSVSRGRSCGKSSCWVLVVWFNGIYQPSL